MGFYGGSTTVETKTDVEMSPEQREFIADVGAVTDVIIEESGYIKHQEEIKTPKDPEKIRQLRMDISTFNEQLSRERSRQIPNQATISSIENRIDSANAELDYEENENFDLSYNTRLVKAPSAAEQTTINQYLDGDIPQELQNIIDDKGPESVEAVEWMRDNSEQVREVRRDELASETVFESLEREIKGQTYEKIAKILNGDISITDDQRVMLDEFMADYGSGVVQQFKEWGDEINRLKDEGLGVTEERLGEVERGYEAVLDRIDDFDERVRQTGLDRYNALALVESRVSDTRENTMDAIDGIVDAIGNADDSMRSAINDSIAQSIEIARGEFDVFKRELGANLARQALVSGRNITDSRFQEDFIKYGGEKLSMLENMLGKEALEAQVGRENITSERFITAASMRAEVEESTGIRMEQLGMERYKVAGETGERLEQSQMMRAQSEEARSVNRQNVMSDKQRVVDTFASRSLDKEQSETGFAERLAQIKANTQMSIAYGMPMQGIGAAQAFESTQAAINAQGISNISAASQSAAPAMGVLANYDIADTDTTKTTTKSGGDFWNVVGGVGAMSSIAGNVMSGGSSMGLWGTGKKS